MELSKRGEVVCMAQREEFSAFVELVREAAAEGVGLCVECVAEAVIGRGLEATHDLFEEGLPVVGDVVHDGEQVAEANALETVRDNIERGPFLADDGDAAAARERICDKVDDDLALSRSRRAVDHERPCLVGPGEDGELAGVGVDDGLDVGGSDAERLFDAERFAEVWRQDEACNAEQGGCVLGGVGERVEESVVVLQKVGAGLGEEAEDGRLFDLNRSAFARGLGPGGP
jgi:hypothetical protein